MDDPSRDPLPDPRSDRPDEPVDPIEAMLPPDAGPADFTRTVELVERYRGGEREALGRLLERYFHRVYVVVSARLPRAYRTVIDVEDVVQRTFGSAFESIERFEHRSEGAFLRWITTIAINECNAVHSYMTALKRGGGVQPHLDSLILRRSPEDGSMVFDPTRTAELPVEVAARRELADSLVECLEELKPNHREVILLRDYDDLAWREVAERLELPSEGAATMLHLRARLALGKALKRRGVSG